MELYTLDENLRRDSVVEGYESLIWTERYSAWGDFQLVAPVSREIRNLLPVDTRLALNKSHRVMTVETIEDSVDDDGKQMTSITGRSLEATLDDRAAVSALAPLELTPKWELTGTPGEIVRAIFKAICVDGVLDVGDRLPFYQPGVLLPLGSIPEPVDPVTISLDPDTLYNSIKKICDVYNLGFRLVRKELGSFPSQLYFEVYTGDDRTSRQTTYPAVIFSPELENLSSTTQLTSNALLKNVAYVLGKHGTTTVYAVGADPESSGFERRVLVVKADDIDLEPGEALESALQQKGLEELAKHRKIFNFDGEIPQFGSYSYGRDYDLGDLLEQRNADGFGTNMRVTEQIFVSDAEGERSYPTLSVDIVVNPGSWMSWQNGRHWNDVPLDVYWDNA